MIANPPEEARGEGGKGGGGEEEKKLYLGVRNSAAPSARFPVLIYQREYPPPLRIICIIFKTGNGSTGARPHTTTVHNCTLNHRAPVHSTTVHLYQQPPPKQLHAYNVLPFAFVGTGSTASCITNRVRGGEGGEEEEEEEEFFNHCL